MDNETKKPEETPVTEEPEQTETAPETESEAAPETENASDGSPVEDMLKATQAELDKVKDQLLRSLAEYDNFRKRSVKERENAYLFSKSDVLTRLLPVLDNFERAAANESASFEDYKKGIGMIYQQFVGILKDLGVESFGEAGEPFDPNIHSAVMHAEDESMDENVVAEVFGKGYRLGEKVLRPATVKVVN